MLELLVISRDADVVRFISAMAGKNLWDIAILPDFWDAMEALHFGRALDVLLLDLSGGNLDARRAIRLVRKLDPQLPVIFLNFPGIREKDQLPLEEGRCTFLSFPLALPQLKNAIRRSVLWGRNDDVAEPHLSAPVRSNTVSMPGAFQCKSLRSLLRDVREAAEREAIAHALTKTRWNRKAAARLLDVSYRSILYKIDLYQMVPPDDFLSTAHYSPAPGKVPSGGTLQLSRVEISEAAGDRR